MDLSLNSKDDRKARIAVFIFSILLFFLILYPFWSYTFPPPEKEGILVSFGDVEVVAGDQVEQGQREELNEVENEVSKEPIAAEEELKSPQKITQPEEKSMTESEVTSRKASPVEVTEIVTKKSPSPEEIRKKEEADEAAEEARKQKAYEQAKKQFGDLLGKGSSQGDVKGNTGDTNGDPSSAALDRISKGKGKIAGGLADRGLIYEPEIDERSQKAGIVVVRVCVNNQGKVTEAAYTQRGSTTTDTDLVKAAVEGARRYRFSKSPIEKQCGSITVEFKLQ